MFGIFYVIAKRLDYDTSSDDLQMDQSKVKVKRESYIRKCKTS